MNRSDLIIKKHVAAFREKAGIGISEAIDLHLLLEKLNVTTMFRPLSENFSGMALNINEIKFMFINSNQPVGRQNFTIGHELFHLFIEKDFSPHKCHSASFDKQKKDEYNADLFSTHLLMPEDGLLLNIPEIELTKDKISIETILTLEKTFGVSHSSMLIRLKSLGLISESFLLEKKENIKVLAKKYGYDISLYEAGNENKVIGNYKEKVHKLFENEKISEAHFHELMNSFPNDEKDKA